MKALKVLIFFVCLIGFQSTGQVSPVKSFSTKDILPHNTVRSLFLAKDGALWVGTDNGLVRKFNSGVTYYFEENGLPANNIWAITEDVENQLWAGSYGNGVAYFDGKKFVHLPSAAIHDEITVLYNHGNHLFVGTGNGFSIVDIQTKRKLFSFSKSMELPMRIYSFFEFGNKIYATTYTSGIYEISISGQEFSVEQIAPLQPLYGAAKMRDSAIFSSKDTIYQIALEDLKNRNFHYKKAAAPSIIWNFVSAKNQLYAAGWGIFEESGGLFTFSDSDNLQNFKKIVNIESEQVTSLVLDRELNYLYVGTLDKGLLQYSLDPCIRFYPSRHSKTLAIDHFGNLPIRLYNDALEIGDRQYDLQFFKDEEMKFVSRNRQQLPQHEDFFYEINYDTPASSIVLYGI